MPYTPDDFEDSPSTATPITAAVLAHMQTQYSQAMADFLVSPALTGNPTAPTPVTTDNDTSIATTAFVKAVFEGITGGTGTVAGDTGKAYRVVAAVIRHNGTGFEPIIDSAHAGTGVRVVDPVTTDVDQVTLHMSFTAAKVGTVVVCADERYAQAGYSFGPSVGTNAITIKAAKPTGFHDYVTWDGSNWVSQTGFITSASMNGTTGLITFNHATVPDAFAGIMQLRTSGANRMSQEGQSATTMSAKVYPYNSATAALTPTTDMKFWIYRPGMRNATMAELNLSNSNIWIFGIFEVA